MTEDELDGLIVFPQQVVRPVLAPICWPQHDPDPDTGTCFKCGKPTTVYDRWAGWYEELVRGARADAFTQAAEMVRSLLPKRRATIVDLACGPGLVSGSLVGDWWKVVGVDASGPMVELARRRLTEVLHRPINSTMLPAGAYSAVMSTLSHTDLPWPELLNEAYRLLEPGGAFVYVGVHPCFVGPHASRLPAGLMLFDGGWYGSEERLPAAPGYSPGGFSVRMGVRHLTLPSFLSPLLDPRWEGLTVIEGPDLPVHIGVRVHRAPTPDEGKR